MADKGPTLAGVKSFLAYRGMTISKKDGEYRVNFADKDGIEDNAYYTNDLADAQDSGEAMATARYVRNEDAWKTWPRCPLKRKPKGGTGTEPYECATLIKSGEGATAVYVVYLVTMFQAITDDTKEIRYATEHQLVADGWKVD